MLDAIQVAHAKVSHRCRRPEVSVALETADDVSGSCQEPRCATVGA